MINANKHMVLTSPSFQNGQNLEAKFSCDGEGVNPALVFTDPPEGTKSLVLIMHDPDAPSGEFVHWVVFNMAPDAPGILEGEKVLGVVGRNSLGTNEYVSPCPPIGTHHYVFRLYALDTMLGISEASTKTDVLATIKGHILSQVELVGLYERKNPERG